MSRSGRDEKAPDRRPEDPDATGREGPAEEIEEAGGAGDPIGTDEGEDQDEIEWVAVAEYGARYEVELPVQTLENAGIPVVVQGIESGIWGPGFAGPTSQGITLLVPAEAEEEARELLELD